MSHKRERSISSTKTLAQYLLSVSALALISGGSHAALAADSQQNASQAAPVEITITGSRIKRASDFDTPNPTTVVDDQYLQNLGIVNLGDAMVQIPANVSTFTPTATGNSNFFAGSTIANLRGINPFFGSRTLTLIDGRRHVPTNQGDSVDLNFIPSVLVQRMDVVTGGASAAYGSGAVSGVNNVILNKTLEGAKVEADYGITGHGDGDEYHIGAAAGTKLFGDRGHLVLGGEYEKLDQIGCIDARDWCSQNQGFYSNSSGFAQAGMPFTPIDPSQAQWVRATNLHMNQISYTGVFQNNFLPNTNQTQTFQSNAAGTGLVPFHLGSPGITGTAIVFGVPSPTGTAATQGNYVIGGDGLPAYYYTNLRGDTDRHVFHGHFDYDITDSINFQLEGSYGKVNTRNRTGGLNATNETVYADNAYVLLNPGLLAIPGGGSVTFTPPSFFSPVQVASAILNKDWTSQINSFSEFNTAVWTVLGDLNGDLGISNWTWDLYVEHGHTKRVQLVNDNRHLNAYNLAADAVLPYATGVDPTDPTFDPADPANYDLTADPICRAVRNPGSVSPLIDPALAAACVPINPFGTAAIPADAKAYAFGFLQENEYVNQTVAAANVTGDLFEGIGAGPVGLAIGGEFRKENIKNLAEPQGQPGYILTDYLIQYGDSFRGKVDVWETYGEINIPIFKDMPMAENLEIDGAIRYSHYKNTGQGPIFETRSHNLTTWKVSGIYDPTNWLRIRGSQSRDARAGNFRELYYGQILHSGGIFGFCDFPFNQDPCDIILQGNPDVSPEKSNTSTVGVVLTPGGFADGFRLAADYYRINLKNGITPAGGPIQQNALVAACRADLASADCGGNVVFDDPTNPATSSIASVLLRTYNARTYLVKGVDFSADYNHELSDTSSLSARLIATKMFTQKVLTVVNATPINIVNQTGSPNAFLSDFQSSPSWVANLFVTLNTGPVSVTAQGRFISKGKIDYQGTGPEDPNYQQLISPSYSTNRVPFYEVYNLSGSYTFEDFVGTNTSLQLFLVIDNVFDKDPPFAASGNQLGGTGTNPVYYDTLGRRFKFGIRAGF